MPKGKIKSSSKWLLVAAAVAVLAAGGFYLRRQQETPDSAPEAANPDRKDEPSQAVENPTRVQQSDSEPDTDKVVAQAGAIKLSSPDNNEVLKNGSVIAGTTSLAKVNYRIIDLERGVLDQGELPVKSGKFSGVVQGLSPSSDQGRLDVYSIDPNTGREVNVIQISVRFE